MSEVKLFALGDNKVRFGTTEEGQPYAVASDYAKALGHKKTQNATDLLDSDEKGYKLINTPTRGKQKVSIVFEYGMLALIAKSQCKANKSLVEPLYEILQEMVDTKIPAGNNQDLQQKVISLRKEVDQLERILHKAGNLYIILTGSGLIKMGRTRNWPQRLSQYHYQASIWGGSIEKIWISLPIYDVAHAESIMIKACKKKAIRGVGREYFHGLSWNSVTHLAERVEGRFVERNGVGIDSSFEHFLGTNTLLKNLSASSLIKMLSDV
jgi:hypothetical protein